MSGFPVVFGPDVQRQLGDANKVMRAETEASQAAAEEFAYRCMALAPIIRAVQAQGMAEAAARERKAEAEQLQRKQQREANLENYRIQAMLEGRRWRTPLEIVEALRGEPV